MSSAPVDNEILESLRDLMEEEFDELVESYIEDTQILLDGIRTAIETGDAGAVQNNAHAMKSSSAADWENRPSPMYA